MTGFQNPYMNPFGIMPQIQQAPVMVPTQVVRVNGENGARAYQLGANSSALLLDESGTAVWLVTTDGAGYKTVAPYDIKPHQNTPSPDYGALENRIKKLEEIINGNSGNIPAAHKMQPGAAAGKADDRNYKRFAESAGGYQLPDDE